MNDEQITLNVSDLDRIIEERLAAREKAAQDAKMRAMMGATPGCNCALDGVLDRKRHQFGCPWADPKATLAAAKIKEMFG